MIRPFRIRRSLLFVPAVRPDRYAKALATGVDAVCIDLEDGVGFSAKGDARTAAIALFSERSPSTAEVSLRINDPKGDLGRRDLDAMLRSGIRPDALMLPKVSGPQDVVAVTAVLGSLAVDLPLIVQLETAQGIAAAHEIGVAAESVSALFFGAIDFSADVGCTVEWDTLLYARSRVVLASALAGVSALDSPFMTVPALDALNEESGRVRRLGFVGKAAIHPTQVSVIQKAFSPTTDEVTWARRIVAAYEENEGGVLLVDGQLIERPVILAAQRTLKIASQTSPPGETTGRQTT